MTFLASIALHVRTCPDAAALSDGQRTLTWAELDAEAARLAAALRAQGVAKGDRIAVAERNTIEFATIFLASASIGAITVPLNWRLGVRELAVLLPRCAPSVIFTSQDLAAWVAQACDIGGLTGTLAPTQVVIGSTAYRRPFDGTPPSRPMDDGPDEDAPCLIMFSSGSTGTPKGVLMSHAAFGVLLPRIIEEQRLTATAKSLQVLPFFHIGGLAWLVTALMAGAYSLLCESDARSIMEAVDREAITHLCVVPTLLSAMLEEHRTRPRSARSIELIQCGGSPIPDPHLREAATAFGCSFVTLYGLSEAGGLVAHQELTPAQILRGLDERELLAAGWPVRGLEVRICDPASGQPSLLGEVGEITVRSPARMIGYWQQPGATAEVLDEHGWLRTGDLGLLDDSGRLTVRGRLKDMIISGGENIYPAEIENVLVDHPSVALAAVVGAPHPRWVEAPVAVLVPAEGHTIDTDELREWLRARLATYKCPRSFVVVDDLPRLGGGKANRSAIRTLVATTFAKAPVTS
jgi:long-chain acyl-CoA synthetase